VPSARPRPFFNINHNKKSVALDPRLADSYLADTRFFERVEHPSEGKMLTTAILVAFSTLPATISGSRRHA
jgi:hypothetical protein